MNVLATLALGACGGSTFVIVAHYWNHAVFWMQRTRAMLQRRLAQTRLRREAEVHFADLLIHMATSLKAGLTLQQACVVAAGEWKGPFGGELSLMVAQLRTGLTIEQTFHDLARRLVLDDVTIVAQAISILQSTGGNLIEVFEKLAATIHERRRVSAKIRTLTAQGMVQAAILLAMPWGLVTVLSLVAPDFVTPLWNHPWGRLILSAAVALEGVGAWSLRRIVTINV